MDMRHTSLPEEEHYPDGEVTPNPDLSTLLETAVTEGLIDESQYETLQIATGLIEDMIHKGLIPLIADTKENREKYGNDLNPVVNSFTDFQLRTLATFGISAWVMELLENVGSLNVPSTWNSVEEIATAFAVSLPVFLLTGLIIGMQKRQDPDYKQIRQEFFTQLKTSYREFMSIHNVNLESYPTPLLTNLVDTQDGTSSSALTFEISDEINSGQIAQLLLSLRSYQQMFPGLADRMVVIIPHSIYHELYELDITTVLTEGVGRKRKSVSKRVEPYRIPTDERYRSEVVDFLHPNVAKSALLIETGEKFDKILVDEFGFHTISRTNADWVLHNKVIGIEGSTIINGLFEKYSDLVPDRLLDFETGWEPVLKILVMTSMFFPAGYPLYAWARNQKSRLERTKVRHNPNLEA